MLDGAEMIALAQAMASGTLPEEPFYRAPLYPAMLAVPAASGVAAPFLPMAAQLLNFAAHLSATAFVFLLARRLFERRWAALVAALLWGLNPVALHFAGDPLDITVAIAFGLAALYAALRAREDGWLWAMAGALVLALACLTRPHFFTLALGYPVFLGAMGAWRLLRKERADGKAMLGLAMVWLAAPLLAMGALGTANALRGQGFQAMPTQGAFNLWAANRAGANGLYFTQTVDTSAEKAVTNPARRESMLLFERATGESGEPGDAAFDAYWRERAIAEISANPGNWLALMARKGIGLLHPAEPYNNKTYAFHKARSPWLRWNPLGWFALFAPLLAVGVLAAGRSPPLARPSLLLDWAACCALFAAGILLYYASARFRLPLAAMLAPVAGGALFLLPGLLSKGPRWRTVTAGVLLFAYGLFSVFGGVARTGQTSLEDRLHLARASLDAMDDHAAIRWAEAVLPKRPGSIAARDILATARFNLLAARLPGAWTEAEVRENLAQLGDLPELFPRKKWVEGVYLWKLGQKAAAEAAWRELLDPAMDAEIRAQAWAALIFNGLATLPEARKAAAFAETLPPDSPLNQAWRARKSVQRGDVYDLNAQRWYSLFAPATKNRDSPARVEQF